MKHVYVIAKDICPISYDDDRKVPGIYAVTVPESTSNEEAASIALDAFHESYAVKNLDEFQFTVTDGSTLLEELDNHENGSKADMAGEIEFVTAETPKSEDSIAEFFGQHGIVRADHYKEETGYWKVPCRTCTNRFGPPLAMPCGQCVHYYE